MKNKCSLIHIGTILSYFDNNVQLCKSTNSEVEIDNISTWVPISVSDNKVRVK